MKRKCTKCGASPERTKEFWSVDKREPDGLGAQCRKCRQAHDRDRWKPGYVQTWTCLKKKCSFCGARKPLSQFFRHVRVLSDGRDTRCKECTSVRLGAKSYQPLGRQVPKHDYAKTLRALVGHRVITRKLRIGAGIGFKGQKPPDFNRAG